MAQHGLAIMEFHVKASARDYYGFDLSPFSSSGNVIFADFAAARRFASQMNAKRPPEQAVSVGQISAMGLIDEMLHVVVEQYRQTQNPQVMQQALSSLEVALGPEALERTLQAFAAEFPPIGVYRGEIPLQTYLAASTQGRPNREIVLEEMLMLWMANANPAFTPFLELFDDTSLEQFSAYLPAIHNLEAFFEAQPAFAETGISLFKTLRLPALNFPGSLDAQLEFLLTRLGGSLGRFAYRLLIGRDVLREEARSFRIDLSFDAPGGFGGTNLTAEMFSPRAQGQEYEPEAFSADLLWMPQLVLIAKNAFVWLDQLSKQYGREIRTLDAIPDAELDRLASWGVTGLWLIGLWERSTASKRIKQMMGNPDAVASAYSLYDYVIAQDLGGEAASNNLRERAWQRGIRMASDMVPNHVGIDGKWVYEHPDWFISLPYPPYPNYTFGGPDLSSDQRVGIFLEDHYYDKSDAAVVFKRLDRWTGSEQYIYHGNDGTAMPWNDTAQLNYLNAEVREAVIQTILHVARQFPVIRFDAAMTLAKRHIQRLWWPEPGGSPWGASIPSRAEFALSKEEFDRAIPLEFWREVVDRVAAEAPDTLLLAEAFWMMEGYFVRTLGMHRVYNSAFMNMLRDEKNAEYRKLIKETLEFEPEILKRYVNFLSNPDEKTAVEQFGKSDKYFGVMTLCATLPGLPMLGHGQAEGYTERYGMEYRRAYYQETPDQGLIEYHRQQIFPLLKRRYLFAEVENFVLYDFYQDGGVNEDVLAYSNRSPQTGERSMVIYNNKHQATQGWLRLSVGQPLSSDKEIRQRTLSEGLGLAPEAWSIFRDSVSGLEFIRSNPQLSQGLYLELGPYGRQIFLDWREVYDSDGSYARVAQVLGGRGVASVEEARLELELAGIHTPFRELVNPAMFRRLIEAAGARPSKALLDEVEEKLGQLHQSIHSYSASKVKPAAAKTVRKQLGAVLATASPSLSEWGTLLGWVFTHSLGTPQQSRDYLDEWRLGRILEQTVRELGVSEAEAQRAVGLTKLLVGQQSVLQRTPSTLAKALPTLETWSHDPEVQHYLGFNRFQDVLYFNREPLQALLRGLSQLAQAGTNGRKAANTLPQQWEGLLESLDTLAHRAGYQVDAFLALVHKAAKPPKKSSTKTPAGREKTAKSQAAVAVQVEAKPTKANPRPKVKTPARATLPSPVVGATPKTPAAEVKTPQTTSRKTSKAKVGVAKSPTKTKAATSTAKSKPTAPTPVQPDDLTRIEGIGPKISLALQKAKISTFAALARSKETQLREALAAAGLRFAPSLSTWAKQASYLAKSDEKGFRAYTQKLTAGREIKQPRG